MVRANLRLFRVYWRHHCFVNKQVGRGSWFHNNLLYGFMLLLGAEMLSISAFRLLIPLLICVSYLYRSVQNLGRLAKEYKYNRS